MRRFSSMTGAAFAILIALGVAAPSGAEAAECQRKLNLLGPNASDTRKLDALVICAEETRTDLAAQTMTRNQFTRDIAALKRDLTALETKMARDIAAGTRVVDTRLTTELRTLRTEIQTVDRNAKAGLRSSEMGTNETLRMLRGETTAAKAKIEALVTREWKQFGVGARVIGRSFSNDTARPIFVAVTLRSGGQNSQRNPCHGRIKVDGMTVAESRDNNTSFSKQCFVTASVPPGSNYVVESAPHGGGGGRIANWAELR